MGDNLTPWILRKLGVQPIYTGRDSSTHKYMVSGSILSEADENCTVWGAGIGSTSEKINPKTKILSVRGPISRAWAMRSGAECPDVCGDPGMLMPLLYDPTSSGPARVGVIPHFVDQVHVFSSDLAQDQNAKMIDILDTPESVADAVVGCEFVVSSSLHGLVVSMAYGVPCVWVKFSDRICGDGIKYYDFAMSVGVNQFECFDVSSAITIDSMLGLREYAKCCDAFDTRKIVGACPFWKS